MKKMCTQLRWFFLLVYARACLIENPIIDSEPISKRGLQPVDDVFYVLANTKPTLTCKVNVTADVDVLTVPPLWFLNGELQNSTDMEETRDKNMSLVRIFYAYDAGSSFARNELKCVLNVSSECHKESAVFLQVARPVSEVKAYYSPNGTRKLTAPVGTRFETYCTADGLPEATFLWLAKYPGSTLWNEVAYSKNFTEYVIEEELPGPTFYRCQAVNIANRDTNIISSPQLELNHIEPAVTDEPTWVVTVKSLDVKSGAKTTGNKGSKVEPTNPIIAIASIVVATIVIAILIFVGVILYIKYRRRRLEHSDSDGKSSSRAMKPYVTSHPSFKLKRSTDPDTKCQEVPSYIEIIPDSRKGSLCADILYLTPKSSPKFLPLPNIPGRIPSAKSSPTTSDIDNNNSDDDDENIYNEINLYENDPPSICIANPNKE